ncbi:MAG TPA: SEC-C metal-binding domain-containing protein [Gammaproteobacteria bacterium]|jgi:hypothetical protein
MRLPGLTIAARSYAARFSYTLSGAMSARKSKPSAVGRNEPCPCGSGKKYKRCCALKATRTSWPMRLTVGLVAICLLGGLILIITSLDDIRPGGPPGRVWSAEHGHWH